MAQTEALNFDKQVFDDADLMISPEDVVDGGGGGGVEKKPTVEGGNTANEDGTSNETNTINPDYLFSEEDVAADLARKKEETQNTAVKNGWDKNRVSVRAETVTDPWDQISYLDYGMIQLTQEGKLSPEEMTSYLNGNIQFALTGKRPSDRQALHEKRK